MATPDGPGQMGEAHRRNAAESKTMRGTVGLALLQRAPRLSALPPQHALAVPFVFSSTLLVMALAPSIRESSALTGAFVGGGTLLVAWMAVLYGAARRRRRTLAIDVVLRKQHYLQAFAQCSILLYWGWHWRPVYESAALIAAQVVFAYAFDMLLSWSRRDTYALGFAPFPVVFSINLFLWFKPQWFYLQFLLVAVGFAAKELIRWNKDGRPAHIFNPSSFPLALFSVALILTDRSAMTWGPEIAATQLWPPHIYLFIFLVGLPGQFFFGVTPMTLSAVATTYLFGLLYFAVTGTYFFFASYIPIAVFLGMHLLFTDPSTSPRTELGRLLFGFLYGLSVVGLYALFEQTDTPSFYDKLLPVPVLNLSIKLIDRIARSKALRRLDPAALGTALAPRERNLAYITLWTLLFTVMSVTQGVGDSHPGHSVPFWQQACREGRRNACRNLERLEAAHCKTGSGWACNELGIRLAQRAAIPETETDSYGGGADDFFRHACDLGFFPGCQNVGSSGRDAAGFHTAAPDLADYAVMMLEGKGRIGERTFLEMYQRACQQGWTDGCERAGRAAHRH
jgi:hypothetical protein